MKRIIIISSWVALAVGGAYAYTHQDQVVSLISKFISYETKPLQNFANQAFQTIIKEISAPAEKIRSLTPVSGSSTLTTDGIIRETNKQRALFNLPPLSANAKLSIAAGIKAEDMLAKDYFEHVSPLGVGPAALAENVGYAYILIGENLAMGHFKGDVGVVQAWMDSPGHRANILNPRYTEIGVHAEKGEYDDQQVWMAVQEFGKPVSDCPAVSQSLKVGIDSNSARLDEMSAELQRRRDELEDHKPKRGEEYNRKIDEYNALAEQYNYLVGETRAMIEEYNSAIVAFNTCASSNRE